MNLKILIAILIVGVLAVAIPVSVKLAQKQTQLKSQATACPVAGEPGTTTTCGVTTYDTCIDTVGIVNSDSRFCQNPGDRFKCWYSGDPNACNSYDGDPNNFNYSCSACGGSGGGGSGGTGSNATGSISLATPGENNDVPVQLQDNSKWQSINLRYSLSDSQGTGVFKILGSPACTSVSSCASRTGWTNIIGSLPDGVNITRTWADPAVNLVDVQTSDGIAQRTIGLFSAGRDSDIKLLAIKNLYFVATIAGGGGGGGSGGSGDAFTCNAITTTPGGSAPLGTQVQIGAGGSVTNYPNSSMSRIEVWVRAPNQTGFTQIGGPIGCSGSTQSCNGSVTWNTGSINNGAGLYTIAQALVNTNGGSWNGGKDIASCNTTYTLTSAGGGGAGSQATGAINSITPSTVTLKDDTHWNDLDINYNLSNSEGTGRLYIYSGPPCNLTTCNPAEGWTALPSNTVSDGTNRTYTWTSPDVSMININATTGPGTRTIGLFTAGGVNGPLKVVGVKDVTFNPPPPNGSSPPATADEGSACTNFLILDKNGADVTRVATVFEKDTYTFEMTMKNERDTTWTKPAYKLIPASGDMSQNWEIPTEIAMPRDSVAKTQSVVFSFDAKAKPLGEGKNFENRNFFFGMSGPSGAFGAACEPRIRVIKKLTTTKCYVLSDNSTEVTDTQNCEDTRHNLIIHRYTDSTINYLVKPTTTAIYVKFFNQDNVASEVFTKPITLSSAPTISRVDCTHLASGTGTQIIVNGVNFGEKGNGSVKVGNLTASIGAGGWTPIGINASVDQRLEGTQRVTVTTNDGRTTSEDCVVNTTTVTFSAKNQCSQEDFGSDDVDVKIYQAGEEPVISEKIKLDKAGKAQGFTPKLEKNKNYTLLVKAPGSLAKKKEFKTGTGGTTVIEPIILPVGDIAPRNNPDGNIRAQDAALLVSQWRLKGGTTKASGDLNDDGAVNSIDWSCMRLNFGASDERFTPAASATPAPSSSASPSPSGSVSPSPSPSASPSPSGSSSPAPSASASPSTVTSLIINPDKLNPTVV